MKPKECILLTDVALQTGRLIPKGTFGRILATESVKSWDGGYILDPDKRLFLVGFTNVECDAARLWLTPEQLFPIGP